MIHMTRYTMGSKTLEDFELKIAYSRVASILWIWTVVLSKMRPNLPVKFNNIRPLWKRLSNSVNLTLPSFFHILIYVSICSSFELLADESCDLSQAEKKITVVKVEQIHKMTIFQTKRSKVVILSENSEFAQLWQQTFSSQLEINHVNYQPSAKNLKQMEWALVFTQNLEILGKSKK